MTKFLICVSCVAGMLAVGFLAHTRQVQAEDDCYASVYAVERLPLLGLVCIAE